MNFILNNKLATFLIFMIFYCLFNYQLKEGFDVNGRYIKNRKTGKVRVASSKEIKDADAAVASAMEEREVSEAAKNELKFDRAEKLNEKTPAQQKKEIEGAGGRFVEKIDGETGQSMEKAQGEALTELQDKGTLAETGSRLKVADNKMVAKAAEAAKKLSKMAMASTMKDVARAQDAAIENLRASVTSSKGIAKKAAGVAASYGLADQGEGFNGVVGAGSEVSGSAKYSKAVIKQRDRVATQLPCKKRCKYLYDDQTAYICDSGNCICKIERDGKYFRESGISARASEQHSSDEPTKSGAAEPAETKPSSEKPLYKGAVCVGIGDNKVRLKEWYAAQKWTPSACKAKCKETKGCKFYSSRLNDNGACILYSDCPKQRSDGEYEKYNVYAVGDTEGFRSGFSIPEENKSKYLYRIHGKCDTTEIDRGDA